ncbi:hypothetical protein [Rhodoflexus caldus]|uniref:hypothetical protein n=1 Tax=Rhodoflexus caldus TaxID=2891236 RepID=UPI00202A55CB|nr:hypothetical protein [Rhodoflexus caldus]
MKSLVILFLLLFCAHVSTARKALPITICEADLTAPVSHPLAMETKQLPVAARQKPAIRQQAVQQAQLSSSSVIGIVAALGLCVVAGAYIRYKQA